MSQTADWRRSISPYFPVTHERLLEPRSLRGSQATAKNSSVIAAHLIRSAPTARFSASPSIPTDTVFADRILRALVLRSYRPISTQIAFGDRDPFATN